MDWADIPSLPSLRAFEAAVRNESLSKAASELNVTHAAIAQHVRKLEEDFGLPLLVRQGRGVAATPEGKALADSLRRGFSEIAVGVRDLKQQRNEGPLNITTTPSFAANWLMPRMGEFWEKHRDIPVNIVPNADVVNLRDEGMDLSIRFGKGDWDGLESEMLTGGGYCVICHPDFMDDRKIASLKDLDDQPWLLDQHMQERIHWFTEAGVNMDDLNVRYFPLNTLVSSAVRAQLGITIQPRSLVDDEVRCGLLKCLLVLEQPGIGYYLASSPGIKSQRLKTFIRWLKAQAAAMDAPA